jgi:hypothetical protein
MSAWRSAGIDMMPLVAGFHSYLTLFAQVTGKPSIASDHMHGHVFRLFVTANATGLTRRTFFGCHDARLDEQQHLSKQRFWADLTAYIAKKLQI